MVLNDSKLKDAWSQHVIWNTGAQIEKNILKKNTPQWSLNVSEYMQQYLLKDLSLSDPLIFYELL